MARAMNYETYGKVEEFKIPQLTVLILFFYLKEVDEQYYDHYDQDYAASSYKEEKLPHQPYRKKRFAAPSRKKWIPLSWVEQENFHLPFPKIGMSNLGPFYFQRIVNLNNWVWLWQTASFPL